MYIQARELTIEEKRIIIENKSGFAELMIGNQRVMMNDNRDIPFQPSRSLCLTAAMDAKEEVVRAFGKLKEGREIICPTQRTDCSSCFVSRTDPFGFRWVVMTEQTER